MKNMVFTNEYDVSDVIATISALIAVVGGFFAYIKWKKSIKNSKSRLY